MMRRVRSICRLDTAIKVSGELRLDGWTASATSGSLEKFKLRFAGKTIEVIPAGKNLRRADVQTVHPELCNAGDSGFVLHVPLSPNDEPRVGLIALTPIFEQGEGDIVMHLLNPYLPVPSQSEIARIGENLGIADDYLGASLEFLGYFVQLAGLQPQEHVLEVGSGIGRMAFSLAHYLAPTAHYHGLDIVEEMILWCRRTISSRFANFRFTHADLYNQFYNRGGRIQPIDFVFPADTGTFDFVVLTSVFTHLSGREMRHYLDEVYRVLRPSGRCLATFYLMNDESERLIQERKSIWDLIHPAHEGFTIDLNCPERCIGFKESLVQEWIGACGLNRLATHYGSWCGRPITASLSDQDIVILQK
jgi:SAM-dependent methyltransferase